MSQIERAPFFDSLSAVDRRRRRRLASPAPGPVGDDFHQTLVQSVQERADDRRHGSRPHDAHDMQRLFAAVTRISQRLHTELTWSAVLEYREAIGELLSAARQHLSHAERIVSSPHHGHSKQFVLITTIDNKMNTLMARVLQRERSQLNILALVGEINGLLVDLRS